MEPQATHIMNQFVSSLLFSLLGLVVFGFAFWLIVKLAPFSVQQEIEKDQNVALGVVIAAVIIGVAMIISAAIHG